MASKKPVRKPASKKAPAKKPQKQAAKKPMVKKSAPAKKAAPKKSAPKKAPAKKPIPAKKAPAKPAQLKPVAKPTQPPQRPKPISIVVSRRPDREPSVFMRSNEPRGPGGIPLKDAPKPVGLDRARLGALQGKIFTHVADFDARQKLAHMVSDISVASGKPRIQKNVMLEDLKKVARAVKAAVPDAQAREAMLNDLDAFGAVVRGGPAA